MRITRTCSPRWGGPAVAAGYPGCRWMIRVRPVVDGVLAEPDRLHRVNDAVRKEVRETGVLKGRRRAVGSTIPADAVATQDTVTQLVAAIRQAAREAPGAAEQIARVRTGHDYGKPGKPKIDWDDAAAKDALVNDANAMVAALEMRS
jgi:hypothetical protein